MNPDHLCMGCMSDKGAASTCPHCGWREDSEDESTIYLKPGTILNGKYLVGRVLGHGGFGITYLGWDKNLEIKLAIKEYLPRDLATRSQNRATVSIYTGEAKKHFKYGLEKFLEEGRALAKFESHPGVVSVRDFFEENGTAYLAMHYIEGFTFKEYLEKKGGKISFATALKIMMPVMDALREVHAVDLIHRDISPDNIYITKSGQVKLIDFGAARYAMGEHSRSLSIILKPGFAPEEQYRSKGRQGPWTDIYAVAATIYRAVTGRIPPESLDRLHEDTLKPPSNLGADISTSSEKALIKALSVRAAGRFQTIKEFQDGLEKAPEPPKPEPQPEPEPEVEQTYIHVNCPNCKTKNTVPEGTSLKEAKCKSCGSRLEKEAPPPPVKGKRSKAPWAIAAVAVAVLFVVLFFGGEKERYVSVEESEPGPSTEALNAPVTRANKPRQPVQPEKTIASRQGDVWRDPVTNMAFVWVPRGSFMMGSPDSEEGREDDEGPVHEVYVDGFRMGKYEVTNAQFTAFLNDKGMRGSKDKPWFETKAEDSRSQVTGSVGNFRVESGYDDYPVVNVSWYGADAFAKWLSGKTGHKFRLPMEAEWEYACRAGTTTPFYFGDTISVDQANYNSKYVYGTGSKGIYREKTTSVGSFLVDDFGLCDMHGNVREWCEDWYDSEFYRKPAAKEKNPLCEDSSSGYRVLRGGSWIIYPRYLRCANRDRVMPDYRDYLIGFRLIRLSQDK